MCKKKLTCIENDETTGTSADGSEACNGADGGGACDGAD